MTESAVEPVADRSPTAAHLGADLGVLAVAAIWGSTYLAMKWLGDHLSVPTFLVVRFGVGALVLTVLLRRRGEVPTGLDRRVGMLFGGLLFVILALETTGVRYTLASNAGFLISLSVVLVPVIDRALARAAVPAASVVCAVASLGGCALLALSDGLSPRSGDLIILAAALVRAGQIVLFGRRASGERLSLVAVTTVELWTVTAVAAVWAMLRPAATVAEIGDLSAQGWAVVLYLGLLGTAFAFLIQLHAARVTSPTRVGLVLSTEPAFAAAVAIGLGGEHLTGRQLAGGVLVVVAAVAGRWFDARRSVTAEAAS